MLAWNFDHQKVSGIKHWALDNISLTWTTANFMLILQLECHFGAAHAILKDFDNFLKFIKNYMKNHINLFSIQVFRERNVQIIRFDVRLKV